MSGRDIDNYSNALRVFYTSRLDWQDPHADSDGPAIPAGWSGLRGHVHEVAYYEMGTDRAVCRCGFFVTRRQLAVAEAHIGPPPVLRGTAPPRASRVAVYAHELCVFCGCGVPGAAEWAAHVVVCEAFDPFAVEDG